MDGRKRGMVVLGLFLFIGLFLFPLAEAGYDCEMCGGDGWVDAGDPGGWAGDTGSCPTCGGDGCVEPGDDGYVSEWDDDSCGGGSGGSGDCCGLVYWTSGIAFSCVGLALWKKRTK